MTLWPTGISLWCTDERWIKPAWKHMNKHYRKHGTFYVQDLERTFHRRKIEWKPLAVAYFARRIAEG